MFCRPFDHILPFPRSHPNLAKARVKMALVLLVARMINVDWQELDEICDICNHWQSLADQGDGKGESCGKRETIAVNPSYVSPGQNTHVDC